MGAIFGGKNSASQAPTASGVPVQTAVYGLPIPIAYGVNRASANMIFMAGFAAHTVATPDQGSGKGGVAGGGGGKGGPTSQQTTYSVDVMFALCEGPIFGIGTVWENSTATSLASLAFSFDQGGYGQVPWAYIQTTYGLIYPYSGFAWVGGSPLQLGTSAQMPNFNFEIAGFFFGTAPNGHDAEPSLVVQDFLTNPHYGAGFPSTAFGEVHLGGNTTAIPGSPFTINVKTGFTMNTPDTFLYNLEVIDNGGVLYVAVAANPGTHQYTVANGVYTFNSANTGATVTLYYAFQSPQTSYQSFTRASGIGISPVYTTQQQASSMVDEIATNTYASLVWSSGVLKIVPRGVVTITGNGVTFTPQLLPFVDLSDDDFLENQGSGSQGSANMTDPIIISRKRPADQINNIKLEAVDRNNQYAPVIAEVTDQGMVDAFGRRSRASAQVHFFTDVTTANIVGQLLLQDEYIRNEYTFTTDARYAVLEPMDIVTVSQTSASNPIFRQFVRITEITENDDGSFTFNAEEYPTGTGGAAIYSLNRGLGALPDFNVDPGFINAPIFFIPPNELTNAPNPEIFIAISGASPNWGGCDIYVSTDNNSYQIAGSQKGATRMGALVSGALSTLADPDTADTIRIDLTESRGQLLAGTQDDANRANTMCYFGGEICSYSAVNLVAPFTYSLSGYFRRGQYHTPITNHPIGTGFFRIDNGVFILTIDKDQMDQMLFVKFLSFNIYGAHKQLLSDVTPYSFLPSGSPVLTAPTGLAVFSGLRSLSLVWINPPQRSLAGIEVWRSQVGTNTWNLVAELGNESTAYTDGGLLPNTQYGYVVNGVDLSGNVGPQSNLALGTTLQVGQTDMGAASIPPAAFVPASISSIPIITGAVSNTAVGSGGDGTNGIYATVTFTLDVGASVTLLMAIVLLVSPNADGGHGTAFAQLVADGAGYVTASTSTTNATTITFAQPINMGAGTHTAYIQTSISHTPAGGDSLSVISPSITVLALKR